MMETVIMHRETENVCGEEKKWALDSLKLEEYIMSIRTLDMGCGAHSLSADAPTRDKKLIRSSDCCVKSIFCF